jgi:Animal haem peroxidase
MAIISTTHDGVLLNGEKPLPADALQHFTPYCYLLPELANDDSKSLIPGSDVFQTRDKLAEFATLLAKDHSDRKKSKLPAVYTYFGQFLNHDTSAPIGGMVPTPARAADGNIINIGADLAGVDKLGRPESIAPIIARIRNQHALPLSLHSLYGSGPCGADDGSRQLYVCKEPVFELGKIFDDVGPDEFGSITKTKPGLIFREIIHTWDLKRKPGKAIIADQRNDENLIISQLHLAFMLFHNNVVKVLRPKFDGTKMLFDAARQLVTWHYHWCIIHDYLDKLLFQNSIDRAMNGPNLIKQPNQVPMEFTTAAFRFGHSMVSDLYNFNKNFVDGGIMGGPATLMQLFQFTSRGKMGAFNNNPNNQLPSHWVADWSMLTTANELENSGSDPIDTLVSGGMINMGSPVVPFGNIEHGSIVSRNILRGFHRRIPSGQSIARALGFSVLAPDKIAQHLPVAAVPYAKAHGLTNQTPAWLYFLSEAESESDGKKLGPVASRIIAATVIGLLKLNGQSVLNACNGLWTPDMSPLRTPEKKQPINDIESFLQFAGVLNEN